MKNYLAQKKSRQHAVTLCKREEKNLKNYQMKNKGYLLPDS